MLEDLASIPKCVKGSTRIKPSNDPMEVVKEEFELEERNCDEEGLGNISDSREDEADLGPVITFDYDDYSSNSHEIFYAEYAELSEDKEDGLSVYLTQEEARALSAQMIDRR